MDLFQQKICEVGLDECEGLMHLLYGDQQNLESQNELLKKVLLYKFYVTRKEEFDECKYEILPALRTEIEQSTPGGWGKTFPTKPLWKKSGTTDLGRSNMANDVRQWRGSLQGIDVKVPEQVVPHRYDLRNTTKFKYLRSNAAAAFYGEPENVAARSSSV